MTKKEELKDHCFVISILMKSLGNTLDWVITLDLVGKHFGSSFIWKFHKSGLNMKDWKLNGIRAQKH